MVLRSGLILAALGLGGYLLVHETGALAQIVTLVVLGLGIGASMTAASSAIMFNAPPERAGMAASIEEVSFELGGAIGIAVLGTIMSVVYTAFLVLPEGAAIPPMARDSLDEALLLAEKLPAEVASELVSRARLAFEGAFTAVVMVATAMLFVTGAAIWWLTAGRVSALRDPARRATTNSKLRAAGWKRLSGGQRNPASHFAIASTIAWKRTWWRTASRSESCLNQSNW